VTKRPRVKHMTAKGSLVDTILFLVMVRMEGQSPFSRPFLVRANSLWDAYRRIIAANESMFQHPRISLEAYVLGLEEMPEAKAIARSWWLLAGKSEKDFEQEWRRHGSMQEEAE
jgi:hypothetical protein